MTDESNPLEHFNHDELLWFLSEGLMLTDMEGVILSLNDAGSAVFGYGNCQELMGKNIRDLFWKPEDLDTLLDTLKKTREIREYLIFGRRRDGRPAYVQAFSRLHPPDAEQPQAIATMFKDISERELFKRALQRSEKRYKTLFDNISEGYVRFAGDSKVVFINPAGAKMLGFDSPMDVLGETLWDMWGDENAGKDYMERLRATGEVVNEKAVFKLRDGRTVTLEMTERLVKNRQGEIIGSDALFRDVTERQVLQERLVESSQKYSEIVNNSSDVIAIADAEGRITYLNPAYERILGYPPEEETGKPLDRAVVEEDRGKIHKAVEELRAGIPVSGLEVRNITSDGREVVLSWNASPVRDTSGRVTGMIAVGRDVTESKRAEEVLREGERFLSNIFASIQDGITILDTNHNILRVNPTMERWYSHVSPMVGGKCYEVFRGRREPCETCPSSRAMEAGAVCQEVVPKNGPGGEIVGWLDLYSFPLLDTDTGQLKGVIEYVRDITERKRAEEELQGERDFSANLLESSPAFFVAINAEGRTLMMNKAMLDALGYSRDEVVGKDYLATFVPERDREMLSDIFGELVDQNEPTLNINHVLAKDGRELLVEWHGSPILEANGNLKHFFGVGTDITDRRHAEEELREQHNFTEAILNTATALVLVLDREGKIIRTNPALQALTGYSEDEVAGRHMWDTIVPKRLIEQAKAHITDIFARGKPSSGNYPVRTTSGEERMIAWHSDFIRDAAGQARWIVSVGSDITETLELRKKIEQSERLYRSLVENSPDIVMRADTSGKIIFADGAGERLTGYKPEEAEGKPALDFVHPEDRPKTKEALAQAAAGKTIASFINRTITRNGEIVHLSTNALPITNEKGEVAEIQLTCSDVTPLVTLQEQLKQYSEELEKKVEERTGALREEMEKRAEEERYMARFCEAAHLAFVGTDENGLIRQWNSAAQEMFGYTFEEVVGKSPAITVPPDRMHDFESVTTGARRAEKIKGFETVGMTKDGRRIDVELDTVSLLDENGRHVRGLCLIEDITDKKAARREIEQARARLQMILDEIPEYGIFSTDANLVINYFGPGCERLLGWKAGEVIGGKDLYALAGTAPTLREAMSGGRPSSDILPMLRGDGSTVDVAAVIKPILDADNRMQGIVAVLHDISREREMIDRLFEDARHKALGAIIVGLTADFDEMLNRLEAQAALASDDPGFAKRLAEGVHEEIRRARSLINTLTKFSHPATRPLQLLDATAVVDEVARMLEGEFQMAGVCLVKTYDRVGKTIMRKEDIQHALLNLLVAGMNSAGRNGTVEVIVRQDDAEIVLTVRDNGEGIEAEDLSRVFDPRFWVEQPVGTRRSRTLSASLGLGLIAARKTAEEHGGRIEIESEIGVGTAFKIKLPVRTTRRGRKTTGMMRPVRASGRRRDAPPLKVLIADDEEHIRSILVYVAKEWHHIPDAVGTLAEARNLCSERKFDVLFVDAGLGGQADLVDIIAIARTANHRVRVFLIAENPENLPHDLKALSDAVLDQSFGVEDIHKLLSGGSM